MIFTESAFLASSDSKEISASTANAAVSRLRIRVSVTKEFPREMTGPSFFARF